MASQVLDEPVQGRAEGLRLCISRTRQSTRRRPRRALKEAGGGTEITRMTDPAPAAMAWVGASTRRTEGLPDAGEKIRIHRLDRPDGRRAYSSPGRIKG